MTWCKVLALCVAVLASVGAQETSVSLTVDKNVVDPLETVTFICTLTGSDLTSVGFLRWQRVVEGQDIPITLATNRFLEPAFKSIGRFSSDMNTTDTKWVGSLTITGVTTEDAGVYRCRVPSLEVHKDAPLTVTRDVTAISMVYVEGPVETVVTEGMEVTFKNGDELRVKCSAVGVNPVPEITISVGGQELEADVQESRHFEVLDANVGSIEEWYDVMKDVTSAVTYAHIGKDVTCTVQLPGEGRASHRKAFTIQMEGMPPVMECRESMVGRLAVEDLRIVCNVTARPPVTVASVQFYLNNRKDPQNLVTIEAGGRESEKSLYLNTTDSLSQVTLHFNRVFMQDFRNYTFVVENGVGRAEKRVEFVHDPDDVVISGSSTWRLSAAVVAMTLALAALQLH